MSFMSEAVELDREISDAVLALSEAYNSVIAMMENNVSPELLAATEEIKEHIAHVDAILSQVETSLDNILNPQ